MVDRVFSSLVDDDKRNTISSQALGKLREAILRGDLRPGAKINLSRLSSEFEISLTPLREALARLLGDRLVEFEDNRGYRVAPLSMAGLIEIVQLRLEFEGVALRRAIAAADTTWESEVLRALHRLNRTERKPDSAESLDHWELAHARFHQQLLAACGLPILIAFCSRLRDLDERYRRILSATHAVDDAVVAAEHAAIAEVAMARQADAACSALASHIEREGEALQSALARSSYA